LPSDVDIVSCVLQVSGGSNGGCVLVDELGELKNVNINAVLDTFMVFTQPFNTMLYSVPCLAPAEISTRIIWPVITTAATWYLIYLPSHSLFARE